jgi:hypothetical protein
MSAGAGRMSRDVLLGWAAGVLVGGAVFAAIGDLLRFIQILEVDRTADSQVAGGFRLLGSIVLIPAFVTASVAFFLDIEARAARLGKAGLLAAAAYATFTAGEVVATVAIDGRLVRVVVVSAVGVAASFALMVAASVTAVAFNGFARTTVTPDWILRDGRLGRANISLSVGGLLLVIGGILDLLVDRVVRGVSNAGVVVATIGSAILIGAGVIAAVAFLISRQHQQRRPAWMSRRDGTLGLSAVVFALAFLTMAIGGAMQAGAWSGSGIGWKSITSLWLSAATYLVFAAAAVTASIGFFRSRESVVATSKIA